MAFIKGPHGLAGEMYTETAAKGADIYLPEARQPGHGNRGAKMESLARTAGRIALPQLGLPLISHEALGHAPGQ
ncbi:unnamed protein product [Pleuronectes platessa]|uniref:Uncharacterized protein n=1 Tax=Pleuronectes platessa TaxID=8262 RepID=A0A9N7Y872_PLEPL|nr:unnamed protein product [Pleuronectes platessa]